MLANNISSIIIYFALIPFLINYGILFPTIKAVMSQAIPVDIEHALLNAAYIFVAFLVARLFDYFHAIAVAVRSLSIDVTLSSSKDSLSQKVSILKKGKNPQ